MKAELDIKPFLKATNEFGIAEQQPCGVQVVDGVGLVACGFQFFTRITEAFARGPVIPNSSNNITRFAVWFEHEPIFPYFNSTKTTSIGLFSRFIPS